MPDPHDDLAADELAMTVIAQAHQLRRIAARLVEIEIELVQAKQILDQLADRQEEDRE